MIKENSGSIKRPKSFLDRLIFLLGCALIVLFFSELYFYNEGVAEPLIVELRTPSRLLLHLSELSFYYLLAVAPAVLILSFCRVSSIWGIILAGGILGYLVEGLVVPAIYLELPISLFWTALSWHPLIDVVLGLWLLQIWLRRNRSGVNLLIYCCLGILWGIWSTWPIGFPSDLNGEIRGFLPINTFAGFAFVSTGVLFIGNLLIAFRADKPFLPTRLDYSIFSLTSASLFCIMFMQVNALALLLPVLVGLLYLPLRFSRMRERVSSVIASFETAPSLRNQLTVWVMPVTASMTFWIMSLKNWHIASWVFAGPLIICGFALVAIAAVRLLWTTPEAERK